ncbi:N-acetylmuramoyl-L-alanine amidase [Nocardia sp. NBC_00565]|uniref:N-acetylmuramoyl-L-alanine amidase n=1 Tax=Nocardia sp. NBC_00565 TaxID=2975993 RepID=UPI002E80A1B1|nr:N-acetylmuramoyl-L-alanine amidase [Nocardia sp. NBC_00565]WUC04108.1 N-acetylmuramoyl-L-alanine amidase [Nocardia sp. NBC_00565]
MRLRSWQTTAAICAWGVLLGGCTPGAPAHDTAATTTPRTEEGPTTTPAPFIADDRVVVIDPGHNGGNAAQPAQINRPVPDGRGKTKACNTTGTSATDGYTEHEFTWDIATRVRDALAARGIRVVMTRDDDAGVGPCVDERAAIGNRSGAAAVVSIHADGAAAGAHGFHVAYSAPPLNAAQREPSQRLATTLRDTMVRSGFSPSTYVGVEGMNPRADLAGLNLSEYPVALVECGNMRDPGDAALIESPDGRARYADAIAAAIVAFLG